MSDSLQAAGVTTRQVDLGTHVMDRDGHMLPPWTHSDDKGPVLGWLSVLQWYHETHTPLPVNLYPFCFEGMEENGSGGLDELIEREPKGWFQGVDYEIFDKVRHAASFCPHLYSALSAHLYILPLTPRSRSPIQTHPTQNSPPITPITPRLAAFLLTPYDHNASLTPPYNLAHVRMRLPALSLHGIEGAFAGRGAKTVILARVGGKVQRTYGSSPTLTPPSPLHHSLILADRNCMSLLTFFYVYVYVSVLLVPPQTPDADEPLVVRYKECEFTRLGTKNAMQIELFHSSKLWVTDQKHWNYAAAARATEQIYATRPDLTREGGSIPVTLTFAEQLGVNVFLLPMGRGDDGAQ
ncbi:hypothetical protein K438DRAFT_2027362 [Mycena galopus ATCC 62051]|nr:hypothetical protein K438DRAFT_2027362 [Mycena galopus ATCC 62051]